MAPIRKGDGTPLDIPGVQEVRTGDGRVFFEGGDAIPDSAIFHWPFDEGGGDDVEDNIGSEDGNIEGAISWDTLAGETALNSPGGSGDLVRTTTWSDFGSRMDEDFAVAFTFSTEDIGTFIGGRQGNGQSLHINIGVVTSSGVEVEIRDDTGSVERVSTDADFNDGSAYRFLLNKTGNSASDLGLYIDGVEESKSVNNSQGFSSVSDFVDSVPILGSDLEMGEPIDATMRNVVVYEDSLSESERQDDYEVFA